MIKVCFIGGVKPQCLDSDIICVAPFESVFATATLASTQQSSFDATRMATGMYIYRMSVNGRPSITNTMLLVK